MKNDRTSDEMQLKGVRVFDTDSTEKCDKADTATVLDEDSALKRPLDNGRIPQSTLRIMAACHSLAAAHISRSGGGDKKNKNKMQVVGDPLELAVLRESGYHMTGNNVVDHILEENNDDGSTFKVPADTKKRITILHRFAFSSKLKRMTVLCTEGDHNSNNNSNIWALSKGAPETIKDLLLSNSIPTNYDDVAFHHMSRGRRVLSMAYRDVGTIRNLQSLKDNGRETIERNLIFAGFLVLDCPLKPDSKSVVSDLKKSGLGVVMITGDAILTAAEVARQVGILRKPLTGKRAVYEIRKKEIDIIAPSSSLPASNNNDPLTCLECIPLGRSAQASLSAPALRSDNIPLDVFKWNIQLRTAQLQTAQSITRHRVNKTNLSRAIVDARQDVELPDLRRAAEANGIHAFSIDENTEQLAALWQTDTQAAALNDVHDHVH